MCLFPGAAGRCPVLLARPVHHVRDRLCPRLLVSIGQVSHSSMLISIPPWFTTAMYIFLYYYRSPVRKNLSSKFDEFLPVRSQFDSDHRIHFSTPTSCQSATFVRPLFAFVLCFLREKIINNATDAMKAYRSA